MAEKAEAAVPSIFELDYTDLKLYQHPPCMFLLWYIGLAVGPIWEATQDFINDLLGGESSPPPPPPAEEEA